MTTTQLQAALARMAAQFSELAEAMNEMSALVLAEKDPPVSDAQWDDAVRQITALVEAGEARVVASLMSGRALVGLAHDLNAGKEPRDG